MTYRQRRSQVDFSIRNKTSTSAKPLLASSSSQEVLKADEEKRGGEE